jgi:hypothetical protein
MLQHPALRRIVARLIFVAIGGSMLGPSLALADYPEPAPEGRYVYAPVVAIEQPIFYNRFGSFNPYGMMYALRRDVVDQANEPLGRQPVDQHGTPVADPSLAGKVSLATTRRPRPLVLRGNVGDILIVDLQNLLPPTQPDLERCRESHAYKGDEGLQMRRQNGRCGWKEANSHAHYAELRPEAAPPEWPEGRTEGERRRAEDEAEDEAVEARNAPNGDWPLSRTVSLAVAGLEIVRCDGSDAAPDDLSTGLQAIPPGASQRYCFRLNREGAFLFSSLGAPAGGEGDGGSLSHGLFGAINVEPRRSKIYRSQVSEAVLKEAVSQASTPAFINYEAVSEGNQSQTGLPAGTPLLAMHAEKDTEDKRIRLPGTEQEVLELVHGDLTAIVDRCPDLSHGKVDEGTCAFRDAPAIREYTIVFHDELKTYYPDELKELESEENAYTGLAAKPTELGGGFNPLAGVRDGFAINYGSSGMGSILLANRKGFGPAKDCVDCAYEEFFLGSWANGDPALLADYPDDPSNVYHSYLGDPVEFRNTHAGPKETHVFHLHAHQWLAEEVEPGAPAPDGLKREYGTYLDSQTIAPLQGFTYEIQHGGSGNLNLTPGDAIFHCHLYPHFAQGMWGLWRVHDVFEDGSLDRRLPDGELRTTPNPAIVPLPGMALAPKPTTDFMGYPFYIAGEKGHRAPQAPKDVVPQAPESVAKTGQLLRHRIGAGTRTVSSVSQAERIARAAGGVGELQLGRELVRHALVTGDFSSELETAELKILDPDGEPAERTAMSFHAAGLTSLADPMGHAMTAVALPPLPQPGQDPAFDQLQRDDPLKVTALRQAGYRSRTPDGRDTLADGRPVLFRVNGSSDKPGAPYADPCRDVPDRARGGVITDVMDIDGDGDRDESLRDATGQELHEDVWLNLPRRTRYDVSAIKTPLTANNKGWHDPQGHINVLDDDVAAFENRGKGPGRPGDAKPFFFRAHSGDCVEFRHTNLLPKELDLDDFQVRTPTDTIGQHIHLVKFDVTASDGSGNGWNYEDGTFAQAALVERLEAAYAYRAQGHSLNWKTEQVVNAACPVEPDGRFLGCKATPQTSIQRWYADPMLTWAEDGKGKEVKADRTLRTVFTHDHFGPSSIQQHGFYSALLVEPRGSAWVKGLDSLQATASDALLLPGKAVGTQAAIVLPDTFLETGYEWCRRTEAQIPSEYQDAWTRACRRPNPDLVLHGDLNRTGLMARSFREFAMAVADFALLYDPCRSGNAGKGACADIVGPEHADHGLAGIVGDLAKLPAAKAKASGFPFLDTAVGGKETRTPRQIIEKRATDVAAIGRPVAPPKRPEAISKDHHDPYLFNYRNEPIPLRVAEPRDGRWRVKAGPKGDMAFVFDSREHGDPATEIFEAFEDERVQVRLIQGAQEVQHVAALHDLGWRREANDRHSPFVGAQEIGISEHFEIGLDRLPTVGEGVDAVDRLYSDTTVDALWNGAWGLLRTHNLPTPAQIVSTPDKPRVVLADRNREALEAAAAAVRGSDRVMVARRPTEVERAALGTLSVRLLDLPAAQADRAKAIPLTDQVVRPAYVPPALQGLRQAVTMGSDVTAALKRLESATTVLRAGEPTPASVATKFVTCPENGPTVRFAVEAWPLADWLGNDGGGAVHADGRNGVLTDRSGLVYRLITMQRGGEIPDLSDGERNRLREAARREDRHRGAVPPLVLRANAGECIAFELTNCLLGADPDGRSCRKAGQIVDDQPSDANPDGFAARDPATPLDQLSRRALKGLLPRIVPLNEQDLTPSLNVDIRPQLVSWDVTLADGVRTGNNPYAAGPLGPGERSARFVWYAGRTTNTECSATQVGRNARGEPSPGCTEQYLGKLYTQFDPVPFGAVPLTSFADVIEHGSQGLVGTLVVEPEGSRHMDPATPRVRLDQPVGPAQVSRATLDNGGQEALIRWREPNGIWAQDRHEMVLVYQDGLGLRWRPWLSLEPSWLVPDCRVCDDSYDLGERGADGRTEPFWYRLGLMPGDGKDHGRGHNLNEVAFPADFLARAFTDRPPATPGFKAKDGEILTFRVVEPAGRARQRAFVLYGHDYPDLRPRHGSSGSALVAPGKAVNAHICDFWMEPRRTDYGYETRFCAVGGAHAGSWLWRDGPAPHFASGAWGILKVE